ncbi:MAG: JAB domain-containing protein [Desulfitobacteriaceae bacterium]
MVLCLYHPGGTLQPSGADVEVTKRIAVALDAISIQVADPMIVAGERYFSFAEKGLL